ncbi:EAL domain-containing protein [Pontibacter sp. JAM-7]|uniref:EAL domain-containing protein n=1 Tax=Pontibacter sp. JAM-7 TaxID=3366581 RepID=UPI003AF64703
MSRTVLPYFQPIIETATGKVTGYEAQLFERLADGSVVPADTLLTDTELPLEERLELDRDVRLQALSALADMPDHTFLAINISPQWLQLMESPEHVVTLDLLKQVGGDPARVIIEITSLEGDIDQLQRLVERYRAEGFRIAVDDFGSGFSQLDRVARLQPDIIKLDTSLLKDGALGENGYPIVQSLGEMASRLGSKVLFQGISTKEEYFLALSCGAVYTQGELFGAARPEPVAIDSVTTTVQELLGHYRDMAIEATSRNHWRAERVKSELLALRELLRTARQEAELVNFVPTDLLLRFYICDRSGNQISPNYENSERGWVIDEKPQGLNWSWRPYFFELLGANDIQQRLVFSEPYQDIHTGQRAQTAVLFIDESRILLADLLNDSGSTNLFSGFSGMPASWIPELE